MPKLRFWSICFCVMIVFSVLTACNTNNEARQDQSGETTYGMNAARNGSNSPGLYRNDGDQNQAMQRSMESMQANHNNTRIENSQEIADQIAAMDGINDAYVLLTDRNAYVAVTINEDEDYGRMGQINPRQLGQDRMLNENGRTEGVTHGSNLQFGEYNTMQNGITQMMKNRVADKVKSLKPEIVHVYVSANPDVTERLQSYVNKMEDGQPVEGFIEEFNAMVQKMFPQESGQTSTNVQYGQMNQRTKSN